MNQFQFRHYWQTTPCFYLLALKSCLMPQSLSNRYYEEFQRWFWSAVLHFKPRTTAFEYKSEEQGKEEGWDWMVWLGSMTWCWFLVCVAVAVEWSWRNSQENEWMYIRDVLGAPFNSLCPVDLIQCVLQNELVFILGIVAVSDKLAAFFLLLSHSNQLFPPSWPTQKRNRVSSFNPFSWLHTIKHPGSADGW